jgi:hypothetical protein
MNTHDNIATLQRLRKFARSRPGFDYGNYGDISAYRSDVRRATRQLNDAERMIRFCELFDITPNFSAFSDRLTPTADGFDYCTGQYYCTEYRAAICACLASGIWAYWRDQCGYDAQGIRRKARNEFGRGIASRWFN